MHRERIRSTRAWRNRGPRHDTAFVVEDEHIPGMKGLRVVRVKLFFSFVHDGDTYPCALVEWFRKIGRSPDPDTGMWKVKAEVTGGQRDILVLHLDTFLRGAHLLPSFGTTALPHDLNNTYTLDLFNTYFVNKYIDHLAHEMVF